MADDDAAEVDAFLGEDRLLRVAGCGPPAQVWVEIGTPVAFCARADARRTFSITGVTPAVSVAHLMMAALTPLSPIPWVMSRMKRAATSSTPWAPKYRCGIHQTPVATITWTRERRATSHDQADVPAEVDGGEVDDRADAAGVEVRHLLLGDRDDGRAVPEVRPVLLDPGRARDDVLVHQGRAELGRRHRAERGLHRRCHGGGAVRRGAARTRRATPAS